MILILNLTSLKSCFGFYYATDGVALRDKRSLINQGLIMCVFSEYAESAA